MSRLRILLRMLVALIVAIAGAWLAWRLHTGLPKPVPPGGVTEATQEAKKVPPAAPVITAPPAPAPVTAPPPAQTPPAATPPAATPPPAVPRVVEARPPRPFDSAFIRLSPLEIAALPEAVRFDYPLGSQHAAFTYNAQPFRITRHLGDDLNGIGGENSDLGDPVFAAGAGRVVYAGVPGPGWGNMLILAHRVPEVGAPDGSAIYQTVYGHLEKMLVRPGEVVQRGDRIGAVGTAGGRYFAHLHFEVRMGPYVNPGVGYADTPLNRVAPERFIDEHRGAPPEQLNAAPRLRSEEE